MKNITIEKIFHHMTEVSGKWPLALGYMFLLLVSAYSQLSWYDKQREVESKLSKEGYTNEILVDVLIFCLLWSVPKILIPIRKQLTSNYTAALSERFVQGLFHSFLRNGEDFVEDQKQHGGVEYNLFEMGELVRRSSSVLLSNVIPDMLDLAVGTIKILRSFPQLALPIFSSYLLFFGIAYTSNKSRKYIEAENSYRKLVNLSSAKMKTLLLSNHEDTYLNKVHQAAKYYKSISLNQEKRENQLSFIQNSIVALMLFYIAIQVASSQNYRAFGWVVGLLNYIIWPLARLSTTVPEVISNMNTVSSGTNAFLKKYSSSLLSENPDLALCPIFNENLIKIVRIEFRNVTYSIESDGRSKLIINNFNMTVNAGEKIVFVGPNGYGKSTLLDLIVCMKALDSGEIRIFYREKDSREKTILCERKNKKFVRTLISSVHQQPQTLFGSKDYNIFLGCSPRQSRKSYFFSEIPNVPTMEKLSGGEAQKLAITRALFQDKPILVLDEATAALDVASKIKFELFLDSYVFDYGTQVTIFRVAHEAAEIAQLKEKGYRVIDLSSFSPTSPTLKTHT